MEWNAWNASSEHHTDVIKQQVWRDEETSRELADSVSYTYTVTCITGGPGGRKGRVKPMQNKKYFDSQIEGISSKVIGKGLKIAGTG